MILAAGLGTRMRPLTLEKPKPLLDVGGRTMLDSALDRLMEHGTRRVVVNSFYLAEQIETHLAARRDLEIILSPETELLDTGGGVKKALRHFGEKPFFVLNADLPWLDSGIPALRRLEAAWDPARMDILLLLMQTAKAHGFGPDGDFALAADGRVHRRNIPPPRPYVMLSAHITRPELFAGVADKVFSNNVLWNAAEARDRLYGLEHTGACYHVGTPDDLRQANALLESGQGW